MSASHLPLRPDRLRDIFRDMVDLYSPSGKEEDVSAYLFHALTSTGLKVFQQAVDDTRANLLVSASGSEADTLFLGHIDTVPAFDIEHYAYEERDGLCRGLGTADMKGGCAALIEAFTATFAAGRLPENVLLALVVGEEENGDGTRVLLEQGRFRRALVAEPTDLNPCLGHFGYVEMIVRAMGDRRHAALSERENHAIRALLRFLLRLDDHVEQSEPETVLNIRDLHSSESGFAAPDSCTASVDLHLSPDVGAEAYARELRPFVEKELLACGASRVELEFPTLTDGYATSPDDTLPRRMKDVFAACGRPWTPDVFKSHSDANLLWEAGCRPVILGPGQLAKAHTREEHVEFGQVLAAAELFACLLDGGVS